MAERPFRVLCVDDAPAIVGLLLDAFTQEGYDARGGNAAAVPDLVAAWVPDLAVVDLALPPHDGTEVAGWLRVHCPGIRLVLYSGQPMTGMFAGLARDLGVDAVLTKPADLEDLLGTVARLLEPSA